MKFYLHLFIFLSLFFKSSITQETEREWLFSQCITLVYLLELFHVVEEGYRHEKKLVECRFSFSPLSFAEIVLCEHIL